MSPTSPSATDNPLVALIGLCSGLWVSRALWAAAKLKVADAVGDQPTPLADIAAATGAQQGNLRRLMNALAAADIFHAAGDDLYGPGPLSPFLRSDHPLSQRAFVETVFGGEHYAAWGAIDESLTSGATAFDSIYGMPVFDWYSRHPDEAQNFSRAMESTTLLVEGALLAVWAPPPFELAVDVGGSRGTLISALLARNPEARGILFDLPDIADSVRGSLPDRLEAVGGSFFESVPEGDLYLLKLILHDWPDAECERILRTIRGATRPGGHVVIIDNILPEAVEPQNAGYLMDLNMMVMTGGRERRASEFQALLERSGFRLESVTPTPLPMGVVQGVAV